MLPSSAALFGSAAARQALFTEAVARVERAVAMIRRAEALVRADRVQAVGLLSQRRQALARHLQGYQQFKHSRIFDPVVQHGPSSSKIVARTMKLDCMQLGEEFGGYHTRWLRLHRSEWESYRQDMLTTMPELRGHLQEELRAIGQLLTISDLYDGRPAPARPDGATPPVVLAQCAVPIEA